MSIEEQIQQSIKESITLSLQAELDRLSENIEKFVKELRNQNENLELLTVKEAARNLKCSPSTVYEYIKKGELKAITVGSTKITRTDYDKFINKQREKENRNDN